MRKSPTSIVAVQQPEQIALEYPKFIVEYQGKLYVTLAVTEYDPKAENATREQQQSVAELQQMFDDSYAENPLRAALIFEPMALMMGMNTSPD